MTRLNLPNAQDIGDSPVAVATGQSRTISGQKVKVLILTQVLPYPADAGPKIKTFNLIKFLAEEYAITLVSFTRPQNTPEHVRELKKYCEAVYCVPLKRSRWRDLGALLSSLAGTKPFLMVRDESSRLRNILDMLAAQNNFSIIHADQLNMASYALRMQTGRKVLDQHNAVWTILNRLRQGERNIFKRLLLQLETYKLRHYEQQVCRRFDVVLAVSAQDAQALKVACQVIPIGVDARGTPPLMLKADSLNLVSLGTMFYPPNVEGVLWFAREVFPLIQAEAPGATYTIIGPRPPASIYELSRQNPNIRVTGYLEDIRPTLEASTGLVVPLLSGGGMRVKILEALALGLPVVSTTLGAEGIRLENGRTALLADTPEEFAKACLKVLSNFAFRKEVAASGRRLALEFYDYQKAYEPLRKIYSQLLLSNATGYQ